MTLNVASNRLVRKLLAAATLAALSIVFAPVANAQLPPQGLPPCGTFDLGGGCGAPTPLLTATFQALSITAVIYGAVPNAMLVIAADVGPFAPAQNLATPCVLHVDQTMLSATGTFQTDAAGS